MEVWGKKPAYIRIYLEVNLAKCFKVLKTYQVFSTTIPLLGIYSKTITRLWSHSMNMFVAVLFIITKMEKIYMPNDNS